MIPAPPPTLARDLIRGTRLVAGLGHSTVLPSMDFETYSEAGIEWSDEKQRWRQPVGAAGTAKGLSLVGAAVYAQHPTTEVLCFAYNLKDGTGRHLWTPGMPAPQALFDYLASGGLIEAWNSAFEQWIWNEVCTRRYGWPALNPNQLRCVMGKARAWGLPGKLELAGEVLGLPIQKDKEGKRLLDKFSVPRNPTKNDPRRRVLPSDEPDEFARLCNYCITDIDSEDEIAAVVPDLEGEELTFWLNDQAINRRGVRVDSASVENCAAIVEQVLQTYNYELAQLTGGTITAASEVQALRGWLGALGVHMDSLDEDAVTAALKWLGTKVQNGELSPEDIAAPYRALEIRQAAGSASVKKVFAIRHQTARGNRLHDLYLYHAARTGRPTGNGPQPTNLPKVGPKVSRCGYNGKQRFDAGCGRYHAHSLATCPWCGVEGPPGREPEEWCVGAARDALTAIASRSLHIVEAIFGNALQAVAGCLRGLFIASEGRQLASSDFTAIEAVVIAALAGEQWRLEVFRKKTDIYLESIARSQGISVDELIGYKKQTGKHHHLRQAGKIQELACLAAETQVLTDRGPVAIVDVLSTDRVWDGIEWVKQRGVVKRGVRPVVDLGGTQMTPDHLVLCGNSWREAKQLAFNASDLCQALETASENLPIWVTTGEENVSSYAPANPTRITSPFTHFAVAQVRGAIAALSSTDAAYSTASLRRVIGATIPATRTTGTMAPEASRYMLLGSRTRLRFLPTWSGLTDGINLISTWIESKSRKATSRVTFDSLRDEKTAITNVPSRNCSAGSSISKPVFDLVDAGPRNRFTILSDLGPLIVHNCGFGGWIGAVRSMGQTTGIDLSQVSDDELKHQIIAWRSASPSIVEWWGGQSRDFGRVPGMFGLEGAVTQAILQPGQWQNVMRLDGSYCGVSYIVHGDVLYCLLPSGRKLAYHRPRLTQTGTWRGYKITFEGWNSNAKKGPPGWMTMDLYGGLLAENVTQAVARDVQRHAINSCEADDYPIVLHIYDEDVADCAPHKTLEGLERHMSTMPQWAQGWPISASGGWVDDRYQKA